MKSTARFIQAMTLIKPAEHKATMASFAMAFVLMASYFILRPVRDAMASDWSDAEVSLLWNIQFFLSISLVALYGLVISRVRFRLVVPLVYGLFSASFLAFYLVMPLVDNPTLVEKGFYLWVSAFSLFNLSVFWSFMSDTFNPEQGRRLFAIVGAGASAGSIVGPLVPTLFAGTIGIDALLLIAAMGLFLVIPVVLYIHQLKHTELNNATVHADLGEARVGGAWWTGFRQTFTNPYLIGISVFIFLYVFISSFIYFEQKNLLAEFPRAERAQILGSIDWLVNSLTFVFAFLFTSRIVSRFGMAATLALLPIMLVFGMAVLAFAPAVIVLLAVQVVRRVGNYAVTRPAREMLFSRVSTEERFKAKSVIDVVVYRGGDAVSGSLFALMTEGLGIGLAVVSLIGSGIAAIWAMLSVHLGRRYEQATLSPYTTRPQANVSPQSSVPADSIS